MNKRKFVFCALLVMICFSFCGCAKVYELSENDEDMIAVYCAKTVSKFNTIKPQGYVNLIRSDQDTASEEEPVQNQEPEEPTEDTPSEEPSLTPLDESAVDEGDGEAVITSGASAALSDVIGIEGLTFDFKNVAAMDYYSIGGYANITPTKGKQFLVVTYNVVNSTGSDVAVDIPSTGIKFKATLNGVSNTADGTIVPTDLSVYQGAIPANHAQEMVLLFQFEPDKLTDLSGLELQAVQQNSATNIIF